MSDVPVDLGRLGWDWCLAIFRSGRSGYWARVQGSGVARIGGRNEAQQAAMTWVRSTATKLVNSTPKLMAKKPYLLRWRALRALSSMVCSWQAKFISYCSVVS